MSVRDLPDRLPEIDYTKYTNRQLAAIPLAVLGVSLLILVGWSLFVTGQPASPGSPVDLGIAFTGGTEVQIVATDSPSAIESNLGFQVDSVQPVRGSDRYIVTTQSTNTEQIQSAISSAGYEQISMSETAASFGADSVQLALMGIAVAFVGMSLVIFILFRTFVPSIAVVISAFSDIVIPIALMNVFGIKLSLGTVAALLMLIGYSVDSDVLLNNHILRRRGGFYESTYRAMRTGVTMTLTSISAMAVMTIAAYLMGIPLLPEIGIVLVFGLSADLMNTYMLNLSLLRWYKYEGVKQ
ncbi:protein translocase subunit SecF [Halorientalis brevis]|uniref:Protein-export membrane protein SecF n=1 Tax=Halorientalis brevis TaxID=1126241 RepID=A0ABD6C7A5_9EURY|nr:protein translocase subunit SecF [Halorientalis brevis]